jgi:hypothetical protein
MSSKKHKPFKAEDIALEHVFVMNASLQTPEDFPEGEVEFKFEIRPELFPIAAESGALVRMLISGRMGQKGGDDNSPTATCQLDIRYNFKINDLENYADLQELPGDLSKELCYALLSVAYSTARGICVSRFQNTVFGVAYLPIVNPEQLLQSSNLRPREVSES